jgi:hypothetical protein
MLLLTGLFILVYIKESTDPTWRTPADLRDLLMVVYPGVLAAYFTLRTLEKRFNKF